MPGDSAGVVGLSGDFHEFAFVAAVVVTSLTTRDQMSRARMPQRNGRLVERRCRDRLCALTFTVPVENYLLAVVGLALVFLGSGYAAGRAEPAAPRLAPSTNPARRLGRPRRRPPRPPRRPARAPLARRDPPPGDHPRPRGLPLFCIVFPARPRDVAPSGKFLKAARPPPPLASGSRFPLFRSPQPGDAHPGGR